MKRRIGLVTILVLLAINTLTAQTTEFTYQGQLQNSSTPATGVFDFEFALFDTPLGGAQVGSTNTRSGVAVTSGIFSVNLDFGASFPGGNRFLEIRVRQGGGSFTTLSPRQPVSSAPYSIKSLTADSSQTAATATNATNAVNATNAINAVNATTAISAASFTGPLAGDVTGTQAATSVARLQGRNVAATQPNNGQVLKFNTTTSQWEPATDETGSGGGGGTITGVTAGTGLTGGGASGSVTVAIANGGVGTTQLTDGSVTDPKIVGVSGAKVTGAVTNSQQLGGVAANQYVQTNDPRLTDARPPTPGNGSYIQNGSVAQPTSNFNISGTGTANTFNALTQYNIAGNRVFSIGGTGNLFAGSSAGPNNTGFSNTFLGFSTGAANADGVNNTFVGANAGRDNVSSVQNTFVGAGAGRSNVGGTRNTYVGAVAGQGSVNGTNNSFFGNAAGAVNGSSNNSFFGAFSGSSNLGGQGNSFFGTNSGDNNTEGMNDSFFGFLSGFVNSTGDNNAFFGRGAGSDNTVGSRNVFVGDGAGNNNLTANDNTFLGTSAGFSSTTGTSNVYVGSNSANQSVTGGSNTIVGAFAGQGNIGGSNITIVGRGANVSADNLTFASAFGAGSSVGTSNTVVLGRNLDTVQIPGNLNVAGTITGISNVVDLTSNQTIGGTKTFSNVTNGTIFNASTHFSISNSRVLSTAGIDNLLVGDSAGAVNIGNSNTFVGGGAGLRNTSGNQNTFFGLRTGQNNLNGNTNAFFGNNAGNDNTSGNSNSFYGYQAGQNNVGGDFNVFVGRGSGTTNTSGGNNTLVGSNANVGSTSLNYATAIGADAVVSTSNTIVLGRSAGQDAVRIPGAVSIEGSLVVDTLGSTTGNVHLCRNTANRISLCTSNSAEEGRAALEGRINDQQAQIDRLTTLVCLLKPDADVCKKR